MARSISEKKREAILAAAAELIAERGTGASTSKISRAAGVAEGTIFTYFPTKDDLLNQLLLQIEADLAATMLASYPEDGSPRERIRHVWDKAIDWGIAHPARRKALRQLKVSDRIRPETHRRGDAVFRKIREIIEQHLAGHNDPKRTAFYVGPILEALFEATFEAIAASPKDRERFKQAGFDLFWKGSSM